MIDYIDIFRDGFSFGLFFLEFDQTDLTWKVALWVPSQGGKVRDNIFLGSINRKPHSSVNHPQSRYGSDLVDKEDKNCPHLHDVLLMPRVQLQCTTVGEISQMSPISFESLNRAITPVPEGLEMK